MSQIDPTPLRQFKRRSASISAVQFDGSHECAQRLERMFPNRVQMTYSIPLFSGAAEFGSSNRECWTGELAVESTVGLATIRKGDWIIKYGGGGLSWERGEMFGLMYEES